MPRLARLADELRLALARRLLRGPAAANPRLRRSLEELVREWRLAAATRGGARAFAALGAARGLKLHLGCGGDLRPGWINVDASLAPPAPVPGAVYINHDLRGGLPLPDGSASLVYSSHFFEHLEADSGLGLMRECHRVLAPGGRFRIALPDLRRAFRAYLERDHGYFDLIEGTRLVPGLEPHQRTLVDFVNYGVYQYGEHKVIYDEEKLVALLTEIGFRAAAASAHDPELDLSVPARVRYTFYVEASR